MERSERREHIGISATFENMSERNNTLQVFNTNDETRNKIPNEVNDFSVLAALSDWQLETHHSKISRQPNLDHSMASVSRIKRYFQRLW